MKPKEWIMTCMIDDPGPFAPLEKWEDYLATIKSLPENDVMRDLEIRSAERVIAEKRKDLNERR
jgi:hypothetical protein